MAATSVILTDFRPHRAGASFEQAHLTQVFTRLVAMAACVQQQTASKEDANRVLLEVRNAIERYGVKPEYIRRRQVAALPTDYWEVIKRMGFVLPDIYKDLSKEVHGADLQYRMSVFEQLIDRVADALYADELHVPDEVVHVCCTGYISPTPFQKLVARKGWGARTAVTNSYHMDCYGAFPAIRIAQGSLAGSQWLGHPKSRVDVVHTEFLSLHTDIADTSPENVVNMTLFGDGFIRYSAVTQHAFLELYTSGLEIVALHEVIIPDSHTQMMWRAADHHFDMTLSKHVPLYIGEYIVQFVEQLLALADTNFDTMRHQLVYAIHPGGPKILDFVQQRLQLTDEQMEYSWAVLREHGNMSSATVPHIWQLICNADDIPDGQWVLSLAFGPGLTACGMLARKVKNANF